MILENFKRLGGNHGVEFFRILMGLIFLSAGLYRILNPASAHNELISLGLPTFITWVIIILEIGGGLLLLFNKYTKQSSITFIIFLGIALGVAVKENINGIIENFQELFIFNPNPTDVFLHLIFIFILFQIVYANNKKQA